MYRLVLKDRKSWRAGRVLYPTFLEAQIRQEELRLKGIKAMIADKAGAVVSR